MLVSNKLHGLHPTTSQPEINRPENQRTRGGIETWHELVVTCVDPQPHDYRENQRKANHRKLEGHMTLNDDEYQKICPVEFRYCLGVS